MNNLLDFLLFFCYFMVKKYNVWINYKKKGYIVYNIFLIVKNIVENM